MTERQKRRRDKGAVEMTKEEISEKLDEIIKGIYNGTFTEIEQIIDALEKLSRRI